MVHPDDHRFELADHVCPSSRMTEWGSGRVLAARDKWLGVVGMRECASLFGGTLEVESKQGQGTTVVARIPALGLPGLTSPNNQCPRVTAPPRNLWHLAKAAARSTRPANALSYAIVGISRLYLPVERASWQMRKRKGTSQRRSVSHSRPWTKQIAAGNRFDGVYSRIRRVA